MLNTIDKRKPKLKPVSYAKNTEDQHEDPPASAGDSFGYMAACPICEKRIFDVSKLTGSPVYVRLKCPHCRKIVRISISEAQ